LKGPLVDVGCGSGTLLQKLKKELNFKNLFGSDFSEESVKLTINRGFKIFKADLTRIKYFKGKNLILLSVLKYKNILKMMSWFFKI